MTVQWWQWPSVERQLVTFAKSFLGPHAFAVALTVDPSVCRVGVCDFERREIAVNPTAIAGPPRQQYLITRGLLVHEVGHARYTAPRADAAPVVHQVANCLEDERIERIMGGQFWSVRGALTAVCRASYAAVGPLGQPRGDLQDPDDPRWVVVAALHWRWAQRLDEPLKGELSPRNRRLWRRVRPLVERAWAAPDTGRVYDLAEEIVRMLGLGPALPEPPLVLVAPGRGTRSDAAEPRPGGAAAWQGPGEPQAGADDLPAGLVGAGDYAQWSMAPPGPLLRAAEPLAGELVARLALPEVAQTPDWSDRYGRLSVRAAIRSQDATPFVVAAEPEPDPTSVAVGVLLDRSGSMQGAAMEAARLATATLHLACAELGIWHAVTAFEGAMPMVRDDENSEQTLARLAGLHAGSGTRIGPSYEALLAQLRPRPEALKVLVLIHDGEPEDGSTVRQLNAGAADARIEVLGLGVALEAKNRAAMRELFAGRFIDCPTPEALAPLLAGVMNTFRRR